MTKLLEWASVAIILSSIWIALVTGSLRSPLIQEWQGIIVYLPVILIFLFGLYAATVVLYRVFTFNNCEEAAAELQKEIKEAKADLRSKGLILKED